MINTVTVVKPEFLAIFIYPLLILLCMKGWEHIGNFGESLKMYGKGEIRRLVDERGSVIVEYRMGT